MAANAQESKTFRNTEDQKLFESAKSLFEEHLYQLAYERLELLLNRHPQDLYIKYLIGVCGIYISEKHEEGLAYLEEVKAKNPKAADIDYYFALLFHKTYQFDKCLELGARLLGDPELNKELRDNLQHVMSNCENGKALVGAKHDTRIQNLGNPPNTEEAEYSPVVSSDEETIFFTYRGRLCKGGLRDVYDRPDKYGFYYEDIYMSHKLNGQWQKPQGLDNINTESNEAVLAISNDGQQLFVFRATENDGGDIYVSRLEADGYGTPEKLKGEINTNSWEGSITLSGDQKKVIFASERPGGFGGKDLYSAIKLEGNTWGQIKNLGETINTPYDDDAPYLHPNGRALVFSSKGHNSMGEFDIFLSEMNEADSSWKRPVNVGYPINTTDDDIFYALSADGKRGYFASTKAGGHGDKDIYTEEPVVFSDNSYLAVIKGKITENLMPYQADIAVYFSKDDKNYGTYKSNVRSGNYLISLPSGNDYKISVYHPVFGEKLVHLNTANRKGYVDTTVNINFGLTDTSTASVASADAPFKTTEHSGKAPMGTAKEHAITKTNTLASGKLNVTSALDDKKISSLKTMTREQLLAAYGTTKIQDLKYLVQLGAYKHPENYNGSKLSKICGTKHNGVIKGNVNLIVADKDFETWIEADAFLKLVKQAGQNDAFITAQYSGKRYYIKDLIDKGVWLESESSGVLSNVQKKQYGPEPLTYGPDEKQDQLAIMISGTFPQSPFIDDQQKY
jgi:Tol biopolymer transport system component